MSAPRDVIVEMARSWIGTPYRHQASCKGMGADCLGLIRGVWREIYGAEPEPVPAYSMEWSEPSRDEALWRAARRHMLAKPPGEVIAGDVALFRMREGAVAKHLGIITQTDGHTGFVHAYSGHGVVESKLSLPWRRRIVAGFEFHEEAN
jgi:NlpC/P60 family putative phage cell wall peptidase